MVQGSAWAGTAAKTDAQENWEAQGGGAGGVPERTGAPSRRMRDEMSLDVKGRVFKRILLIYKITLPQD